MAFISRGIGDGGALFWPAIDHHNTKTFFVMCDMSHVFHSEDGGDRWATVPWDRLQAKAASTQVQFVEPHPSYPSSESTIYVCGVRVLEGDLPVAQPFASVDGGTEWIPIDWDAYASSIFGGFPAPRRVLADPTTHDHLLVGLDDALCSVKVTFNADPTMPANLATNILRYDFGAVQPQRIAGAAFFTSMVTGSIATGTITTGDEVFVATNQELLYYTSFTDPNTTDPTTGTKWSSNKFTPLTPTVKDENGGALPSFAALQEEVVSFAGTRDQHGNITLFAITVNRAVGPSDVPGSFHGKFDLPDGSKMLQVTRVYSMTLIAGASASYWKFTPATLSAAMVWKRIDPNTYVGLVPQVVVAPPLTPPSMANAALKAATDDVVYVASGSSSGAQAGLCYVHRVRNIGSWTMIFFADALNSVIKTGWGGTSKNSLPALPGHYEPDNAQEGFLTFSAPTGLTVVKENADPNSSSHRLLLTDTAFVHTAVDDLAAYAQPIWQQVYLKVDPGLYGSNNEGELIEAGSYYEGSGLQTTVCTWLDAKPKPDVQSLRPLRASYNDMATTISRDGGKTWSFGGEHWQAPPGFDPNVDRLPGDVLQTVHHVDSTGQVHEFAIRFRMEFGINYPYSSVETLDSEKIMTWTGALHKLHGPILNVGPVWRNIKADFPGMPVWITIDPDLERLYVAVASKSEGGVWYCEDKIADISPSSKWTRIPTGPHPFNVRVLSGGRLLVSQSGNLQLNDPTDPNFKNPYTDLQTSGVFVYRHDLGLGWPLDPDSHTDPMFRSWTQDVIVDPRPDKQKTWFACVWAVSQKRDGVFVTELEHDNPPGGAYRTDDEGETWTPIFGGPGNSISVTSCARHPDHGNREIYVCTRYDGLYYSADVDDLINHPLERVTDYPFRAPLRVFYIRRDLAWPNLVWRYAVWVASNGHGLHQRIPDTSGFEIYLGLGLRVRITWPDLDAMDAGASAGGEQGDQGPVEAEDVHAIVAQIVGQVSRDLPNAETKERLREALLAQVETRLRTLSGKKR